MAGEVIGRVVWVVDLNGDTVPMQARELGEKIAAAGGPAGKEWAANFDRELTARIRAAGDRAGANFGKAFSAASQKELGNTFSRLNKQLDSSVGASDRFAQSLSRLQLQSGRSHDTFQHALEDIGELKQVFEEAGRAATGFGNKVDDASTKARTSRSVWRGLGGVFTSFADTVKRAGGGWVGFTSGLKAANDEASRGSSIWKNLSANTRQWTLIIGAVIGSFSDLAVLGSAAGSGLFVVGAALSSLVVTGGLAVIMFSRLLGNIKKLPPALKPARAEFDVFHKAFSDAMDAMTIAAFKDSVAGWKSLTKTVKALVPAFQLVGHTFGQLFNDIARKLAPGTEAFGNLNYFIEESAGITDKLIRSVGKVGDALLAAFKNPSLQTAIGNFLGWVDDLATGFSDFLRGPGFDEWLRHGTAVFGSFGKLLSTTGQLLNDMVTDETVRQLTNFIDSIDGFLQGGGRGIIEFAQNLNIFGLLAKALDELGKALEPLNVPMQALADGVNAVVQSGISDLAPIVSDVAKALAPFVQALGDFMKEHPKEIADGILAIAAAFLIMRGAKGLLGLTDQLAGFIDKMDTIQQKTPTWKKSLGGLAGGFIASMTTLTSDQSITLDTFAGNIVTGLLLGFAAGGPFGALVGGLTAFMITAVKDATDGAGYALDQFFLSSNSGSPFGNWLNSVVTGWETTLNGFKDDTLPKWWQGIEDGWSQAQSILSGQDQSWWKDSLVSQWTSNLGELAANVDSTWADIKTNWSNAFSALVGNNGGWLTQLVNGWMTTLTTLRSNVQTWWGQVTTGWSQFWDTVHTIVSNGWALIVAILTGGDIKGAWERLWQSLPQPVKDAWGTVTGIISGAVKTIQGILSSLKSTIDGIIGAFQRMTGAANTAKTAGANAKSGGGGMASGGILFGPHRILAGEAGPEAIVPMRRPLSMVDPSVRWLSAIAQKKTAVMAAGGVSGAPSRTITVAEGAIQIFGAADPRRDANEVLVRLAEQVAG